MAGKNNKYMSIRLDETLKNTFEVFCKNCGMTLSGAVNMLVKQTIRENKIPFCITSAPEVLGFYEGGERQVGRASIRIDKESRTEFSKVCDNIDISMSRLVKMFMANCLNTGTMPF